MTNPIDISIDNDNVFVDLGFSSQEATHLKIRADLMLTLRAFIKEKGWTQQESAIFFEENQSIISDLMNGEINRLSVDQLLSLLDKTGMRVKLEILAN